MGNKFKFVRFDDPSHISPTVILRSKKDGSTLMLRYNGNGEIEAIISRGKVAKEGKRCRRLVVTKAELSHDMAEYLSKLGKRFWLRKPKVETEERIAHIKLHKKIAKPVEKFELEITISEDMQRMICDIVDAMLRKRILHEEALKILEKGTKKRMVIPLGFVQAYLRRKIEGWLMDEYDLERFVKRASRYNRVSEGEVRRWIDRTDSVLDGIG
jgi:hypothetical protein